MVIRSSDNSRLFIFTTTIETDHKLYTLMHDPAYRMQVASQNAGYNQPPHKSYYTSDSNDEYDQRVWASYITTVDINGTVNVRTSNILGGTYEPAVAPDVLYSWDFSDESQVSTETVMDVPVISGGAYYSEENENIILANSSTSSKVTVDLSAPADNIAIVEFDMNVTVYNSQKISYTINDSDGNSLVYCQFHPYSSTTTDGLNIGGVQMATNDEIIKNISKGTSVSSVSPTHFKNVINFTTGEVLVTITSTDSTVRNGYFEGSLLESNSGDVTSLSLSATKSPRSIYLDNITISAY